MTTQSQTNNGPVTNRKAPKPKAPLMLTLRQGVINGELQEKIEELIHGVGAVTVYLVPPAMLPPAMRPHKVFMISQTRLRLDEAFCCLIGAEKESARQALKKGDDPGDVLTLYWLRPEDIDQIATEEGIKLQPNWFSDYT